MYYIYIKYFIETSLFFQFFVLFFITHNVYRDNVGVVRHNLCCMLNSLQNGKHLVKYNIRKNSEAFNVNYLHVH